MLVYGDPSRTMTLGQMVSELRKRADGCEAGSLDELRALLCKAGQVEQAVEDAESGLWAEVEAGEQKEHIRAATTWAANAFYARWLGRGIGCGASRWGAEEALGGMRRALSCVRPGADVALNVKIPEGFAFYALYPEQYCEAAHQWTAEHNGERALVVGIRSIGTTLSAVVMAVLSAHGWEVQRITVRPRGHPYDRRVEMLPAALQGVGHGLVVDEGPGLSGSSMAAVARALVAGGMDRSHISLLPGHEGLPGQAASGEVREWWATARRYVVPVERLEWKGEGLPQVLAGWTSRVCGQGEPVIRTEDLSGGRWRECVYETAGEWPGVCVRLERMKYRCTNRDGSRALWKFAGLADEAEEMVAELRVRAGRGWTAAPLGMHHGFVALPWIEGKPLRGCEVDGAILHHMGQYIADVAGRAMSEKARDGALERLVEMLICNVREALGEEAGGRAGKLWERTRRWCGEIPVEGYGDGRMAPHEWLRTPAGRIVKTDAGGHARDHTLIGRQSVLWDVAGACVEWGLDDAEVRLLLSAAAGSGDDRVRRELLTFYRVAYAAFRLGMYQLCAVPGGVDEEARLGQAIQFYRGQIVRMLKM